MTSEVPAPWVGRSLVAMLLTMAGVPAAAVSQQDTLFYHDGPAPRTVIVSRDSLGFVPATAANPGDVEDYLESWNLIVSRRMPAGTLLTDVPPLQREGDSIAALVTRIQQDRPDLVSTGGSLARIEGAPFAVVLTDQLIVRWSSGATEAQIDSVTAMMGLEGMSRGIGNPLRRLYRTPGIHGGPLFQRTEDLRGSPLTAAAYPHFFEGIREAAPWTPNDPFLGDQWHLTNSTGMGHIDAPAAWDLTKGSSAVVLAIIEVFEFDLGHPDLVGNLWVNTSETPGNGIDDDLNGCVDDLNGCWFSACTDPSTPCGVGTPLSTIQMRHATAVAGLAAAVGDNSIGVTGVCLECRILPITVGGGEYSRIQAFEYALAVGAEAVNASWEMNRSNELDQVIQQVSAEGRDGLGMPIVFAVGNTNRDVCSGGLDHPSIPDVISVSASNNLDVRITSTGWGDCLDVLAPGGWSPEFWGVATTDVVGDPGYNDDDRHPNCPKSALTNRAYTRCFGGTSASAPIVTGVIGLMLAHNPLLTREQIRDILIRTADKIDCTVAGYVPSCPPSPQSPSPYAFSPTYGYGRVNAGEALKAAGAAGTDPTVAGDEPGEFEIGFRVGWTKVTSGGPDVTTTSVPGSGPSAEPALHVSWFTVHSMLELQGWSSKRTTTGPSSDQTGLLLAGQYSYLFATGAATPYLGVSFAYEHRSGSTGPTINDEGFGVHLGYRKRLGGPIAVRLEGRYRHWSDRSLDEWGVAFGLGVVIG